MTSSSRCVFEPEKGLNDVKRLYPDQARVFVENKHKFMPKQ